MIVYAVLAGAPDWTAPPHTLRAIFESEEKALNMCKSLGGRGYSSVVAYSTDTGNRV